MPLNILLADDSVPAQNMGKKILVDAGYSVQTVSNGLEALRKIAESIPDIAILDIFMPGYTGFEICERLRASAATASLPVILTVGKLEPYRPEDGEHVHSNAVIVKPFAAAELVSAVRSLIGAPPVEAEADPELSGESHAAETPVVDAHATAPEEFAGPSQEEEQDEPLFSYGQSAVLEDTAELQSPGLSAYGDQPLLTRNSSGPQSLVFNPDAAPTPFSASAIDFLPSESYPSEGTPALAEFELGASNDPEASGLGTSTNWEPPVVLAASQSQDLQIDTLIVPEEMAPDSTGSVEAELPTLDIPALDPRLDLPLVELSEAALPASLMEFRSLDLSEPSENSFEAFAPVNAAADDVIAPSPAAQPAQEDEARRLAFEALFDSPDPFSEGESSSAYAGTSIDTLPNIADQSKDDLYDLAPDAGMESLIDDHPGEFIAPELDPYLMQEEEVTTGMTIPGRDLLLEQLLSAPWSGSESAQEPAKDEPAAQAVPTETRELVDPAEILQAAFGPASQSQVAPEVIRAEPESAASEAVHTGPELPIIEPALAYFEPESAPAPLELAPLELAQPAWDNPETHEAEVLSSSAPLPVPESSETERICQAVERVFDRFKPLLVAAIARELAHHD